MPSLDDHIDALYQLAPGEFTAARTQLAKTLKGDSAAAVKALKKPAAVPWAVNQLYWRDRRAWQRVLEAGRGLRTAQVAAIEGHKADVRKASEAHRTAVADASARAIQLASEGGVAVKSEAIAQMLDAVSLSRTAPEHPGRFTDVLHPAAFEALLGVTPRAARGHDDGDSGTRHHGDAPQTKAREHHAREEQTREDRKREEERRARRSALEAAVKKAEHAAERAQEAAARAQEEAEHARRTLTKADAAAREAKAALDSARAQLDALEDRARS